VANAQQANDSLQEILQKLQCMSERALFLRAQVAYDDNRLCMMDYDDWRS
jgi:hypothetical protein